MNEGQVPKRPRARGKAVTAVDGSAEAKKVRRKTRPKAPDSAASPAQATVETEASSASALSVTEAASIDPTDEHVVERVEHANRGAGWALITAGVIGLVVPGVLGTPFLILGGMALWPGNRKRIERWRQGHSPKAFHGAMKQINRFLDDLERRYPRKGN